MFKIFEQLFRGETKTVSGYPNELIKRATDRAIDATDPRLRSLSSHRKQMHNAIVHAIDHVVSLVDNLRRPIPMSGADWSNQKILTAFFASSNRMLDSITRDPCCRDFASTHPAPTATVSALMLAKCTRKQIFGYDTIGDKTVSDVMMTVVSFDEHRFIGLANEETETRRLLKWRSFDYLLVIALQKITDAQKQRQDLTARKKVLKAKLDILKRCSGNLTAEPRQGDRENLQQKMNQVNAALAEMGADDMVFQSHLNILINTLDEAEKHLSCEEELLYLDHQHYERKPEDRQVTALELQKLTDNNKHQLAAQLVTMDPGCMPA